MIVREHDGELILIRQLRHAAVSGLFTEHWGNARFERPEPLASLVLASSRHDEGWRDQDEQPLYDPARKRPAHFRTMDVRVHIPFYREGIHRIIALDPYAGLLVSMHGSGIYQHRYGAGPIRMTTQSDDVRVLMEAFVEEQEALQAALKRPLWNAGQRRSEFERRLWTHYEWLQVWDLLSLFICTNDLDGQPEERMGPVPAAVGGPDVEFVVRAHGDRVVTIDPYPFDLPELDVSVPARAIPNRSYETAEEVRAAVQAARETMICCRIVPAAR